MFTGRLTMTTLPAQFSVCRLAPDSALPDWCQNGGFSSFTRTSEELSIVCESAFVPDDVQAEHGWRIFKVNGPLSFTMTGILASIVSPLAEARISIFAVSTFHTDYLLVPETTLQQAIQVLQRHGHVFHCTEAL